MLRKFWAKNQQKRLEKSGRFFYTLPIVKNVKQR